MIRLFLIFAIVAWSAVAHAQTLNFPSNAKMTREVDQPIDSYTMPIGPWVDGVMDVETGEGQLTQQAWQIRATGLTTLQLIRPLRDQLRNDGMTIVYECTDQACGGFDFRFATSVLPPPDMQINLGDFRYLAARKDTDNGPVLLSIFASKSARSGYIQVTRVGGAKGGLAKAGPTAARGVVSVEQTGDLSQNLVQTGRAVLTGLAFETGSSQLGSGPYDALEQLADFLESAPEITIALVGHTDSSGSLDGNIALSKRRAGSVLERLVADYGVGRNQLDAQGMGYLAPVASNLTEDGRTANRRVEAIITTTH